MSRPILIPLALLSLLSTPAFSQTTPIAVRAATAQMKQVQLHRRLTGSLRAVARGDVAALEEGRVTEVTVREGAAVQQGDIIARVDSRRLEAQKSQLTATLQTVQAQIAQRAAELRQAKLDLARYKRLVDSRTVTVEQYQHRETAVAVAEAQLLAEQRRVAEIESQLQLLAVRLEDAVVRAPYRGRVVQRHAEPGEWIRAGESFVTLVSSGHVEAWLDVPERYLHDVMANGRALKTDASAITVEIRGSDRTHNAISAKRVPDVHSRTRTFAFVLTLDDEQGALAPGMSVDAWVPMGPTESRLTVPKDAVVRSGRTAYVYKALEQKGQVTAIQSPVKVDFETGDLAVVSADTLSAGDQVIVEGNERLIPGVPIMVASTQRALHQNANRMAALPSNMTKRKVAP